ncbi:MAG TPA: hypothetical protein VMH78_06670, partial [Thermoplasmata archaeon]|nr:hypothetical protein [Thermoplasmata archaeon]
MPTPTGRRALTGGERAFAALGRGIVRRPLVPIVVWIVLLAVAVPFLGRLGAVTQNSATTLPASSPSAEADAELAALFPGTGGGSSSYLLVSGPSIDGPVGQAVVVNVTAAIDADAALRYVGGVSSFYTAYQGYLDGMALLALATFAEADAATPNASAGLATAAALEWGPVAAFLANWSAAVAAHPGSDPASANPAALATTQAGFANDSTALAVLGAFYGAPGAPGFNGTDDCASDPANVTACTDSAARATLPAVLASAVPPEEAPVAAGALADLGVLNFTDPAAEAAAVDDVLADESGLPAAWLGTVG